MAFDREHTEDVCQVDHIHDQILEQVEQSMPDDETLCEVAELFKVFGDVTRTKILSALFETELCVCDITQIVKMSMSAVSHQLRILRQTKIVKSRRCGKEVSYSLDDDHVHDIIALGMDHIAE